jgi:hypothetical protein
MIALAAAYAVALSTVLPALAGFASPAMGASAGAWVLCSAGNVADAKRGMPEKPQPPCPGGLACAMPACAGAALRPADTALVPADLSFLPLGPRHQGRGPSRLNLGHDHFARGPPAA